MEDIRFNSKRTVIWDGQEYTVRSILLGNLITGSYDGRPIKECPLTPVEKSFIKIWLKKTEDERIQFRMDNRLIEQAPFNEADWEITAVVWKVAEYEAKNYQIMITDNTSTNLANSIKTAIFYSTYYELGFINFWKRDKTITFKNFLSTSEDKTVAHSFRRDEGISVLFEIESKNGRKIKELSELPNEEEVLFKSNSKFGITSVEKITNKYYTIRLKEVSNEWGRFNEYGFIFV